MEGDLPDGGPELSTEESSHREKARHHQDANQYQQDSDVSL
jgi:hypothetical protein